MKTLQKIVALLAISAFLLVSPVTVLAAKTYKAVKATPTASPTPTIAPTIEPTTAPTPAPQSTVNWIATHKKISLGVLLVIAAIGYGLYRFTAKSKQSQPEDQSKPEDQTPPENTV